MKIAALCIVSVSEIAKVMPNITYDWIDNNQEKFKQMLYELGADVNRYIEKQENVTHRNRFNEIVTCDRYVCDERTDKEWIESPYSSQEAKDKSLNNSMLTDLYRLRGCIE